MPNTIHFVTAKDRKLKINKLNPQYTFCNKLTINIWDDNLTDKLDRVTCKGCLKGLAVQSEIHTSEISITQDSEGWILITCKNLTILEIQKAVESFVEQKKIERRVPNELKDSVDKLVDSLNKKFK